MNRWCVGDLVLSSLLEDLPLSRNLVSNGFAYNKPILVAADEICSKGHKSAKQDLGQYLVDGIEDCDGSKIRELQPVAPFVDWMNDTQLSLLLLLLPGFHDKLMNFDGKPLRPHLEELGRQPIAASKLKLILR